MDVFYVYIYKFVYVYEPMPLRAGAVLPQL